MEFKLILLFYILGNINTLVFKTEILREFCFYKQINSNDQTIYFNYAAIGAKKELVQAVLRQLTPGRKDIHSTQQSENGHYKTNPLQAGKYELCFYPASTNVFSISFSFQTSEEDGELKNIATDTQFKEMKVKIDEINLKMTTLENNAHNLLNRKFTHFLYLSDYIREIKILTLIKILIVAIVSIFQIYVIQKMFGDDKRMSKIKTSKNTNSKSEFL